jgi:hypothetical protein
MVSAYVLVSVDPARTRMWWPHCDRVPVSLRPKPAGQPDIFAYIAVDDDRAMADTVLVTIHAIPGVRTTETHLVAPV